MNEAFNFLLLIGKFVTDVICFSRVLRFERFMADK